MLSADLGRHGRDRHSQEARRGQVRVAAADEHRGAAQRARKAKAVEVAAPAIATDPVCKMQVRVTASAQHAEYAGHSYHFCSAMCREAFAAAPAKYVN